MIKQIKNLTIIEWIAVGLFLIFFSRLAIVGFVEVGDTNDSGWYYGVSQLLAKEGIYGSRLNTAVTNETVATSIHDRPMVQTKEGYELFPSGVTVGPGFIIPQAIVFKVLGVNQFSRTIFPFVAYVILALIVIKILSLLATGYGVVIFELMLLVNPRLSIPLAFQAYSEPLGMMYLLLGLLLVIKVLQKETHQIRNYELVTSGLVLGLSFETKMLYFIGVIIVLIYTALELRRKGRDLLLQKWILIFTGVFLPFIVFELYRFVVLYQIGGLSAWIENSRAILNVFMNMGSGIYRPSLIPAADEIVNKINSFRGVNILVILLIPIAILMFKLFPRLLESQKKLLILLITLMLGYCGWFVFLNTTGWFRHLWPGVFILLIILSVIIARVKYSGLFLIGLFIPGLLLTGNYKELTWNINTIISRYGKDFNVNWVRQLPMPIISQTEQSAFVEIINSLPENENLYFERGFFVGELLSQTDRKMWPLAKDNHSLKYLIIGSAQQGPYALIPKDDIANVKKELCHRVLMDSTDYSLCITSQ